MRMMGYLLSFFSAGMGFGCVMSKAREATDAMFTAAAKALAGCVREEEQGQGHLYPPISRLRETSMTVRCASVFGVVCCFRKFLGSSWSGPCCSKFRQRQWRAAAAGCIALQNTHRQSVMAME